MFDFDAVHQSFLTCCLFLIYTLSYLIKVSHLTFHYFLGGQMEQHVKKQEYSIFKFDKEKVGLISVKVLKY